MKSLITGGSGYFGSLLLRKLLSKGHDCRVFDIIDADDRPSDVEFVQGDIRDPEAIERATRNVDCIYHNVAQVPVAKDRNLFDSVNVLGTEILMKAALKNNVRKVVYTSSSAIFGVPDKNPVTEETKPCPQESYGKAKLKGEEICLSFVPLGVNVSIIRPRTILGHGRLGIFQILFDWIRNGHAVPVLGKGSNVFQFVHADDLAEACILAAAREGSSIYNCGTDRYSTMREALEHLCQYANTGAYVRNVAAAPAIWGLKMANALGISPLGPYHALMYGQSMYFDISKAQRELNWRPKFSNDEMFRDSYDWYIKNCDHVFKTTGASHHRSPLKQGILKIVSWALSL